MKKCNKLVRIVCLMLALLMAVALFAGCKKDKKVESSTTSSKDVTSIAATEEIEASQGKWDPNIPEEKDLGGFEMTIAGSPSVIMPEEGESSDGDLVREAMLDIQKRYNCTITVVEVGDWTEEVLPALLAGDEVAKVLMPQLWRSGSLVGSKVCMDWNSDAIKQYIKTEEAWWNDTMAYASNVQGKVYAGACNINGYGVMTHVCMFNKEILKDVGMKDTDLYKMYHDKTWTWDEFRKIAKKAVKDLDQDGQWTEKDQYGFVASDYDSVEAFISSADCGSIRTENGMNPKFTYVDIFPIDVLTTLNEMYTTDGTYFLGSNTRDANNNWHFYSMFQEGRALFLVHALSTISAEATRNMEDEIGVMPVPLGPKEDGGWQENYKSRVDHNFQCQLIPANNSDPASTALVLEAMAYRRWQLTNDVMEMWGINYVYDDDSAEIVENVYNWSTFEISQFVYSVNGSAFANAVCVPMGKYISKVQNVDVVTMYASVADAMQLLIDDYFAGNI